MSILDLELAVADLNQHVHGHLGDIHLERLRTKEVKYVLTRGSFGPQISPYLSVHDMLVWINGFKYGHHVGKHRSFL